MVGTQTQTSQNKRAESRKMIQATNNVISEVKTADAIKPHPCDSCVQHQTSIGLKHQHSMNVLSRNEEQEEI